MAKTYLDEEKIDISVIIPAYNAAHCLRRAVESVQCQNVLSWELILVENGSTDDTYHICRELEQEDERIRVFQSSKGVSRARNEGIQQARGTWLCFLDADDYLYADAFRSLEKIINADKFNFILFGHNSDSMKASDVVKAYADEAEYLKLRCEMLENPTQYMPVWGKLFLKSIIRKQDILFDEELELAEDADYTFRYMRWCRSAVVLEAQLYHYSKNAVSTVRTYKPGKAQKYIRSMEHMERYAEIDCEEIQKSFSCFVAMHLLIILVHDTFSKENPASDRKKKEKMKSLLEQDVFSRALKNISLGMCKNIRMLPIAFLKIGIISPAVWMVKLRIKQNQTK